MPWTVTVRKLSEKTGEARLEWREPTWPKERASFVICREGELTPESIAAAVAQARVARDVWLLDQAAEARAVSMIAEALNDGDVPASEG